MRPPASTGKPYCPVLLRLHCNRAEGTELTSSYSALHARNHQANETTGTTRSPAPDLRSSVGIALKIESGNNKLRTTRLCKYPVAARGVRATQTAVTARLHHSTRILHNSQDPVAPCFFTHHLRTCRALCRMHRHAWFGRVSSHSQNAILSGHLPVETLPPAAEEGEASLLKGIEGRGGQHAWLLSPDPLQHGEAGARARRTTLLPVTSVSPCCPPRPPGSLPTPPSVLTRVSCTAFCPSWKPLHKSLCNQLSSPAQWCVVPSKSKTAEENGFFSLFLS